MYFKLNSTSRTYKRISVSRGRGSPFAGCPKTIGRKRWAKMPKSRREQLAWQWWRPPHRPAGVARRDGPRRAARLPFRGIATSARYTHGAIPRGRTHNRQWSKKYNRAKEKRSWPRHP